MRNVDKRNTVCLDQLGNVAMAVVSLSFNFWALQMLLWNHKIGRKFPLGQKQPVLGITIGQETSFLREDFEDFAIWAWHTGCLEMISLSWIEFWIKSVSPSIIFSIFASSQPWRLKSKVIICKEWVMEARTHFWTPWELCWNHQILNLFLFLLAILAHCYTNISVFLT